MIKFKWNFPKNKRAAEATLDAQMAKCEEELKEAAVERLELNDRGTLEELMDLYCATENALRKFRLDEVKAAHAQCILKGESRGDWCE